MDDEKTSLPVLCSLAGAAAMMPLSLLIAGPVSDALGIRFWYVCGGAVCILMTVTAMFIPAIMDIENNHHISPVPATD